MERRQELEFLRRELEVTGSAATIDTGGEGGGRVLACILPAVNGNITEGHFYIEPMLNDTWKIHGMPFPDRSVSVSDSVNLSGLAALSIEMLLEARHDYIASNSDVEPLPIPPPSVRARKRSDLAEELVAEFVEGERAGPGNHGFDVIGPDGQHRIQVKSSVRNKDSKRISTLQFKSEPAWADHDELFYIEFNEYNYPVVVWAIESDRLRYELSKNTGINDGKTHQVEPLLLAHGHDNTVPIRDAFNRRYLPESSQERTVAKGD